MPGMSFGGVGRFFTRAVSLAFCTALVLAVSVGLLAGYRWLTTINYFALQNVVISGCSRLSEEHIKELAGLSPGINVLSLSMDRMRAELGREPWVDSVVVKRILPGSVAVEVKEKAPSYLVQYQGTLYYADEAGRIIDKVEPGQFVSPAPDRGGGGDGEASHPAGRSTAGPWPNTACPSNWDRLPGCA